MRSKPGGGSFHPAAVSHDSDAGGGAASDSSSRGHVHADIAAARKEKSRRTKRGKEGYKMREWWKRFWKEEDGIGTVEMILILVGILTP